MSHDDLESIEVADEEAFQEGSHTSYVEDSIKIIVNKKTRRGIRRLIENVLEEQRLSATLKGLDENLGANESASAD